jgi:diguanylate cyclase (GGDEF)-like protein
VASALNTAGHPAGARERGLVLGQRVQLTGRRTPPQPPLWVRPPRPPRARGLGAQLEEARRRADLLQLLSDVSRAAVEPGDLRDVLDRIARFVYMRFPRAWVSIWLLDETGEELEGAAWAGSQQPPAPLGSRWPVSRGVCGRCVRTGEPQHVTDPRADPDWVAFGGISATEYVVPLRVGGELLGVMDVESAERDAFSVADREVLRTLADQVAGAVRLAVLHARLSRANAELQRLSTIDPLTGLPNRRRFEEVLDGEWRRAARAQAPLSLLVVDIDGFKAFNDRHGHPAGDACLRRVGRALRQGLRRAGDFVARWGGEEFVAVLPGTTAAAAAATAETLRHAIEKLGHGPGRRVTISVGVAEARPGRPRTSARVLMAAADRALYAAKWAGRNRVVVSPTRPHRPKKT